jgi:hypothetical protein
MARRTPQLPHVRFASIFSLVLCTLGCAETVPPSQAKVWSTANSNNGYAACPADMTVTGGGFDLKSIAVTPGTPPPVVLASRPEANGWRVICADANGTSACRAWAVCASVLAR